MVCIIVMHVIGYRCRAEMINSSCSNGLQTTATDKSID